MIFFDISLSLACFLGVGQLLKAIPLIKQGLWLIGGGLVAYMGFSLLTDKGSDDQTMTEPETFSYRKAVTAAFTIAWLNPQAILDGTLLLGAFRASLPGTAGDIFLVGVMASSFIWFNSLTTIFSLLKAKINLRILVLIDRQDQEGRGHPRWYHSRGGHQRTGWFRQLHQLGHQIRR